MRWPAPRRRPVPPRKPPRVALDLRGLVGREELFRLTGAARRSRAVTAWFDAGPAELRFIARQWFAVLRECGDDVRELLHDGCPVACVDDVALAYVNTLKNEVNVWLFSGVVVGGSWGILGERGE